MTNPDNQPWRRPVRFGKVVAEAMIAGERHAIGAARALQRARDELAAVRALKSPSSCKDKDDTITRERASAEKAYMEIIANLSLGDLMEPEDARGAEIDAAIVRQMPNDDDEKRWILEPKSQGFDVIDTAITPRQDGFYCYCVDKSKAELIARLLNCQEWGVP